MNDKTKMLQSALALKEKELKLVMAIDHIRDTASEPTAMLVSVVNLLADELDAELCALSLVDRETGEIEIRAINDRSEAIAPYERLLGPKLAARAAKLNRMTIWRESELFDDTAPDELQIAAIPILLNDERLGALLLARHRPFSPEDMQLLNTAEDLIDSAVIQGYNYYTLQRRLKELQTIYRIDYIRDQHLPFDQMLNAVLQELNAAIEAEMGFVMLYDQSGQKLEMRASTHHTLLSASPHYEIIERVARESLDKEGLCQQNDLNDTLRSMICLPLILNEQIIGVLGVVNRRDGRHFNAEDRRLLEAIGSQTDTAIFESIEKRTLRQVLGRSVDPRVMERLLANPNVAFLKGERATLTVLYADLRGSTNFAEGTEPETLVEFINQYLTAMTDVILAHEGTLDKFVGDEVMALFGAPFPQEDHALRAVNAGLAMQKAHQDLLATWRARGIEAPLLGVGMATGELIVGEMGSSQRSDYSVIGKAANLGARICSAAKPGQVLISPSSYELVKDSVKVTPLPGLKFKGVDRDITVYEVKMKE
ncbi:MAG: hypothetical protein B6243_06550 [Anaerolineaceae bacterium 4572_5.2]|nr:MAG: hypothetical protein B6243_06550 [Anaerolineaceae bacterium 4572_5.2]